MICSGNTFDPEILEGIFPGVVSLMPSLENLLNVL